MTELRPLEWMGTSREDLIGFPEQARKRIGYALYLAQAGDKALAAKPLRGFGGAGVLEIISDHEGDTFRTVYTVRFKKVVYVLNAFQKKSKKGKATPKQEMELIRRRLAEAAQHYQEQFGDKS